MMINFVISNILIYTKLQVHCFSLCLPDLMSSKMTNHTFFSKSDSEIAHWLSWTIKVNKKIRTFTDFLSNTEMCTFIGFLVQ